MRLRPTRSVLAVATVGALASLVGMGTATAVDTPQAISEVPVTATDLRRAEANNSPAIAVDPEQSRFLALAYRTDAPEFGCGLEVSGDGGRGWVRAQPVAELPAGAERCYAPEVAFGPGNRLYFLFVGLQGIGNAPMGVFLTSSTDRGRTFSPARMVLGPENYMVRMVVDRSMGENGRLHLVWLKVGSDPPLGGLPSGVPNPIVAAFSDDGGATFSEPVQVSDPNRPRSVAPAVALGADNALHVAYFDLREDAVDYQGLEGAPWPGEWSLVVATSTDGGRQFSPGVLVDDKLIPPGRVMLIFTMAPPSIATDGDGRVFTAWFDARHGDPDAFFSRSPDGGRTWEPPVRLNDDPMGNGADQYLVRLSVAPSGRVDSVFLDRRGDPDNLQNDTYFTYSTDGGRRFAPNVKLTSKPSDSRIGARYLVPSAKDLIEFGARLALVSRPTAALAAWPDTRNAGLGEQTQDVFATEVLLPGDDGGTSITTIAMAGGGAVILVAIIVVATRRLRSSK